jgi:hypothetical protein
MADVERAVAAIIARVQEIPGLCYFADGVLALAPGDDNKSRARALPHFLALRDFLRAWAQNLARHDASAQSVSTCECVHCAGTEAAAAHALECAELEREMNDPPFLTRGRLVGVAGRMGAGKSTLVGRLSKKHGGIELAFAAPLYDVLHYAQRLLGLPLVKDREFLQFLGTNFGRAVDSRVWEALCVARAEHALALGLGVCVSDMRFPNEFEALRDAGARTVRVVRPRTPAEAAARAGTGSTAHASETALDGVAMPEILNDGTLAEFCAKIDAYFA